QLKGYCLLSCVPAHPKRLWLIFQKGEQRQSLFWCFEQPFSRFHLSHCPLSIQKMPLFFPLQSELAGLKLTNSEVLNQDRILKLSFASASKQRFLVGEF